MSDYRVIGTRVPRPDAIPKVTGEAVFIDDFSLPGMLFGAVVRSPYAHARIAGMDVRRAEALPGVRAVLTPETCGLFEAVVRYPGQKVAAVAADNRHIAQEAVRLIEVAYDPLPGVFDPIEAMGADAPEVRPSRMAGRKNVCAYHCKTRGDVQRGFELADVVIEQTYRVSTAHQAYLEPHGCVARFDHSGDLTVWTSIQGQFTARAALSELLDMPLSKVHVHTFEIGGAFGGKTALIMEPIAAALSRTTRAPVKMVMSRREELMDSHPGPGCVIHVKTGAKTDGTLVAEWAEIIYDTGASAGAPAGNFDRTRGLYRIPHFEYEIYSVYTNKLVPGAYRAPGALELTFAFESQLDALAHALAIDPIDLRLKNAVEEGDLTVDGKRYPAIGLRASLCLAKDYVAGLAPMPGRGIGIASGKWMNAVGSSGVALMLNEDGSASLTSGAVDLTGVNTALAQVVAEELGIPVAQVFVKTRGTDAAPYAAVSGGSRTTYGMSLATRQAALRLKEELRRFAAEVMEASPDDLEVAEGAVQPRDGSRAGLSIGELARRATQAVRGPFAVTGTVSNPTWLVDSHIFMTLVAEVDVDRYTGQISVAKISSFQDVGFPLNPMLVEGQIEGGIVQGLGWGLLEGLVFADGVVLNDGFLDYRIPTALDAPELNPVLIQVPSPAGPYGIKGVGEPSMVATPAALANAVFDAVGTRILETPLVQSEGLYERI